jgi:hypothetical protein
MNGDNEVGVIAIACLGAIRVFTILVAQLEPRPNDPGEAGGHSGCGPGNWLPRAS